MTRIILALTLLSAPAVAQTNWTQQQIGGLTFNRGTINGQPFWGTQQQIGQFNFGNFYGQNGQSVHCTQQQLGQFVYTNCQ